MLTEHQERDIRNLYETWEWGFFETKDLLRFAARRGPEAKAMAEKLVADYYREKGYTPEPEEPEPAALKLVAKDGRLL